MSTESQPKPITLARDTPLSLHVQISNAIRDRIASGEWPAHYRLKAEPDLASEMGVSRGTLRRAVSTLIEDGLLRQVQGKGTFVTSQVVEPAIAQRLTTLSEDFASQGVKAATRVLSSRLVKSPKRIASLLDLRDGDRVLELWRTRSTSAGPIVLFCNFVRADLAPGIGKIDFSDVSLFSVLEDKYALKIGSGRRTFSAEPASERVAAELHLQAGAPIQYLEQVTYLTDGRPVEYSDVWINSGKLRVTSVLSRR